MHVWFGYFTPIGVMIGAKGTTSQGDCYYFDVSKEGRLWQIDVELSICIIATSGESDW